MSVRPHGPSRNPSHVRWTNRPTRYGTAICRKRVPVFVYGYRVHGPYDPAKGLRFNRHKLLLDPYAKQIQNGMKWHDSHFGYRIGHRNEDLSFDRRDSAPE